MSDYNNGMSPSQLLPMVTLVPFDIVPNHAPISANVSDITDHRVRSNWMPSALQCQIRPTQHHLPDIIHAVYREPAWLDVRWFPTGHQGFSNDV